MANEYGKKILAMAGDAKGYGLVIMDENGERDHCMVKSAAFSSTVTAVAREKAPAGRLPILAA